MERSGNRILARLFWECVAFCDIHCQMNTLCHISLAIKDSKENY